MVLNFIHLQLVFGLKYGEEKQISWFVRTVSVLIPFCSHVSLCLKGLVGSCILVLVGPNGFEAKN